MEFIAKIFKNKANGQQSIVLPKKLNQLKISKLPPIVKVKITIPKDYLSKVKGGI